MIARRGVFCISISGAVPGPRVGSPSRGCFDGRGGLARAGLVAVTGGARWRHSVAPRHSGVVNAPLRPTTPRIPPLAPEDQDAQARELPRAADELHDGACIGDDTWSVLAAHLDERQLIEVPMLIGHYHLVAFTLNSLGVRREPGVPGFDG